MSLRKSFWFRSILSDSHEYNRLSYNSNCFMKIFMFVKKFENRCDKVSFWFRRCTNMWACCSHSNAEKCFDVVVSRKTRSNRINKAWKTIFLFRSVSKVFHACETLSGDVSTTNWFGQKQSVRNNLLIRHFFYHVGIFRKTHQYHYTNYNI